MAPLTSGKINELCSSKCRLDSYFQLCRINFNSCTVISSWFFVCWKVVQLYNFSAHEIRLEMSAGIKVNFAHENPIGNNCAGIKVNSTQLEITVQSAFGAAQFIDFTPSVAYENKIFWKRLFDFSWRQKRRLNWALCFFLLQSLVTFFFNSYSS